MSAQQPTGIHSIASLPTWAQDYIKRLRQEAQDARNKLKAATGQH